MKPVPMEQPEPKAVKRVPKPQMEKRRRERINNSLETLRLLMLENTQNEKFRNPKVEKAEILESVVEFLKDERDVGRERAARRGAEAMRRFQKNHRAGMQLCLQRVAHFIATKSRELEGGEDSGPCDSFAQQLGTVPASPLSPTWPTQTTRPQRALQHSLLALRTSEPLSPHATVLTVPTEKPNEVVWRPWPQ